MNFIILKKCFEKTFLNHLGCSLKNRETLWCPFLSCTFITDTRPTFSSLKSHKHKNCTLNNFRTVQTAVNKEDKLEGEQCESEAGTSSFEIVRF